MQPVCDDFFKVGKSPSGPSSAHLNPFLRAYLDAVREYLLKLHDEGAPARRVNEEHAELIDRLIRKLFRLTEDHYFEHFPRLNFRLAVIATGGYGRRELSLGSDIDLLFLYRGKINPYVETIAEALTHRFWDAKLPIADATRTINDCMRVGREDLSTLTSLLDARFLIGDPGLYAELERTVRAHLKDHSDDFIRGKIAEQAERHKAFGESLYLLQPNLRESVGGLRDYHTALWIARVAIWEVRRAEHLHVHGFIDSRELADLERSLDFVWRLRNELHRSGRKDDRLHFDAQERLAETLGFETTKEVLAVEDLMRHYYLHARVIQRVNDRVIGHTAEVRRQKTGRASRQTQSVAEGFAIVGKHLEIPRSSMLVERPMRLMSAFAIAQHHDVDISPRAQRYIREHLDLVDDEFRSDPEAADLFRRMLNAPARVYRMLELMDEVGLLGAYIPEFARLVGLWQQDLYHTYTVDIHSLFLVEQLRRIVKGVYRQELPLATELMREVRSPYLLYLTCLFHDIGKGLGGGHSEKGATMMPAIAKRLGLDDEGAELVEFLVRHHLSMSEMADQRDVNDHRLIENLARKCGSRSRLRLLYLLTVSDIRSTSAEAWTSWKAKLLDQLYRNTAEWFEAGARRDGKSFVLERAMNRAAATREDVVEQAIEAGIGVGLAESFLEQMPQRYLLDHEADEIKAHLNAAVEFAQSKTPFGVYSFGGSSEDDAPFWGLVVIARDRPGLFSLVSGVLSVFRHGILSAHAYTTRDGNAIEIFKVNPIAGGAEEDTAERERIAARLSRALEQGRVDASSQPRALTPVMRVQAPSVQITNEDSDFYTIIDVSAPDREALLYDITSTLSELGLEIVVSRASTRSDRATDAFSVTENGLKISDPERLVFVEEALLDAIQQVRRGAG
ncbi:MAG: [protein-PII] uridylyltransferase [bacterium]|nr:[protein-PII] uridylyltransferase [bacterium]